MIDHGQALTLIATGIDFPLSEIERGSLAAHLRDCSACRAERVALQHDAARLAALPPIAPADWVRGAIGKPGRSNRLVLLVAAALVIGASAGVAVVGSILRDDPTALVAPSASPIPTSGRPIASQPPQMTIHCGPLEADQATCFQVVAATAAGGGADPARGVVTEVFVVPGSARSWCAPPNPCISPPPQSYWVEFQSPSGTLTTPVYLDSNQGWVLGVPVPDETIGPQPS